MWIKAPIQRILRIRKEKRNGDAHRPPGIVKIEGPFADLMARLYEIPYTRRKTIMGNP